MHMRVLPLVLATWLATPVFGQGQAFVYAGQTAGPSEEAAFRAALGNQIATVDLDTGYAHGAAVASFAAGAALVSVNLLDAAGKLTPAQAHVFNSTYFVTPNTVYYNALMNGWYTGFEPKIELVFCPPVKGAGMWVFDDGPDDQMLLTVVLGGGAIAGPFQLYRPGTFIQTEGFIGYVDPAGIERLIIEHAAPAGGPPTNLAFQIDSIQVGGPAPLASATPYREGWPGTTGVPALASNAPPVLGSTISLGMGSASPIPAACFLLLGLQESGSATSYGGSLLVVPSGVLTLVLPPSGLSLPVPIPNSSILRGLCVHMQTVHQDNGASHGFAFSPGLKLAIY